MYDTWFDNLDITKNFNDILITSINKVGHNKFILCVLFTKVKFVNDIMFGIMNLDFLVFPYVIM